MSWCWVAFLAEPPTGDELAGAVASATATDLDGRPAGLVAAWRRGRKPLRSAGRVDERVIDPAGPPAWVSLVWSRRRWRRCSTTPRGGHLPA
jgi:hypothetical protein